MLCTEDEAEVFEEKTILSIISLWQLWSRPRSSWWRCCHLLLSLSHVCNWQHVIMHAMAILWCGWYQVTSVIIATSRQNQRSVTPVWDQGLTPCDMDQWKSWQTKRDIYDNANISNLIVSKVEGCLCLVGVGVYNSSEFIFLDWLIEFIFLLL